MTDRLNLLLQDKNIVRLTMVLVAISILVPGVFKVGPPQWLHALHSVSEISDASKMTASSMSGEDASDAASSEDAASEKPVATDDAQTDVAKTGDDMAMVKGDDAPASVSSTQPAAEGVAPSVTDTAKAPAPKTDTKLAAQIQTPRQSITKALKKNNAPAASMSNAKAPRLAVARNFVRVIPASHATLSTSEQKEKFIKMVLPLVLAANEEIRQRRAAIQRAYDRKDAVTLGKWAKLYKLPLEKVVNQAFLDDLLARADVIPVPLALAQAAIESGWGTSRFARQGNALFGQWAWQEEDGIKPLNASNKNAVVRSFPNLLGSVRAYMHNLNTHQAYQGLRDSRKRLAKMPDEDKANMLVNHLHNYAEIGIKYVKDLKIVIRKNKLRSYANAFLS